MSVWSWNQSLGTASCDGLLKDTYLTLLSSWHMNRTDCLQRNRNRIRWSDTCSADKTTRDNKNTTAIRPHDELTYFDRVKPAKAVGDWLADIYTRHLSASQLRHGCIYLLLVTRWFTFAAPGGGQHQINHLTKGYRIGWPTCVLGWITVAHLGIWNKL